MDPTHWSYNYSVSGVAKRWFMDNGGSFSPLCTVEHTSNGLSVYAASDLPLPHPSAEPVLCTCPLTLTLSYLNVLPPSHPQHKYDVRHFEADATKLVGAVSPHVVSWFTLAEQRLLGKSSFWEPYISALPKGRDLTTPICFEPSDMAWLSGTNLAAAVKKRRDTWKDEYAQAITILNQHNVDTKDYTWDLVRWAITMFTSRSFASSAIWPEEAETFSLLFPVIDYFNHSHDAQVTWNFTPAAFSITSSQSHRSGEELCNNYGPKGNEELLMGYGFCIPKNPYDTVMMSFAVPNDLLTQLHKKYPTEVPMSWADQTPVFHLRGPLHGTGGYMDQPKFVRGVPPLLMRVLMDLILYRSERLDCPVSLGANETNNGRLLIAGFRELLPWLTRRRAAMEDNQRINKEACNRRHKYAAIYRDSQMEITTSIIDTFHATLARIIFAPERLIKLQPMGTLVSLNHLMITVYRESPAIYDTYVRGLARSFKHTHPQALQRKGDADSALILLIAAIRYHHPEGYPRGRLLDGWISDLRVEYPSDPPESFIEDTAPYLQDDIVRARDEHDHEAFWHRSRYAREALWASWVFSHEAFEWSGEVDEADSEGLHTGDWVIYMRRIGQQEHWVQQGPDGDDFEREQSISQ